MAEVEIGTRVTRKPPAYTLWIRLACAGWVAHWAFAVWLDWGANWATDFTSTLLSTLVTVGAVIVAWRVGSVTWDASTSVLASACPACGTRAERTFTAAPASCGTCAAYLRATGLEVREESPDALDLSIPPYALPPERYLPVAKRDNHNHFKFAMPAMCAVCGAADAPKLHKIKDWSIASAGGNGGILGAVVSAAVTEVASTSYTYNHHPVSSAEPTPSAQYDHLLARLQAPVCVAHATIPYSAGDNVLAFHDGQLEFASYRYYKAFVVLNGITLQSVTSMTGAPPASSPQ